VPRRVRACAKAAGLTSSRGGFGPDGLVAEFDAQDAGLAASLRGTMVSPMSRRLCLDQAVSNSHSYARARLITHSYRNLSLSLRAQVLDSLLAPEKAARSTGVRGYSANALAYRYSTLNESQQVGLLA